MRKRTFLIFGILLIVGGFGFAFLNGVVAGYKELSQEMSEQENVVMEQTSDVIIEQSSEEISESVEETTTVISE